jgi:hypothetical protein
MGAPTALRPRLTASLPLAPKHWQIHHLPFIGGWLIYLIPEIWVLSSENLLNWTAVQKGRRKQMSLRPV